MRKLIQLYSDIDTFKDGLSQKKIDLNKSCLVKIFTSVLDRDYINTIAKDIQKVLPNCKIVGTYSDQGVIFQGKDYADETLVMVESYKNLEVITKTFSWENKSAEVVAKEVYDAFEVTEDNNNEVVNILFSDLYFYISDFIDEINKFTPAIKLTGGIVCSRLRDWGQSFLFTEDGFIDNGAVAFVSRGEKSTHFASVSTSQESIGDIHELTKVNDTIIEEIDNKPALEWMYDYLEVNVDYGIDFDDWKAKANYDYLIHFPIMREGGGGACRYTRYDSHSDSLMTYFSKLNTGDKFKLGYVNPQKTVHESYELCSKLIDTPVESVFVYVCLFRKLFLSNCIDLDLAPFLDYDICGIYMMGEVLFHNGQNNYYNGCCSFVTLAEEEKFIIPDLSKIKKGIENVKNDGFFSNIISNENNKSNFREQLEANNKKQEDENILDAHLGIYNGIKFKIDKEQYSYDKICMIEIQTADATINLLGEDEYYAICKKFIDFTNATLVEANQTSAIRLYSINYKTFAISSNHAVSNKIFINLSKKLSNTFEEVMSNTVNEFAEVARFVVILNQEHPLTAGLNVLFASKDSQENFVVYDDTMEIDNTSADELKMIDIIKKAIISNKVIPYYQGLQNNKTNKIDKYEALMRLEDETGKVYTPFFFLDIAKKYKFYAKLSRMLIEQALNDFSERTEDISINISLYDIESSLFREWLLDKLNVFPDPTRVVFEIVETEEYNQYDVLYQFLDAIRATGAKVAIDDFGSGYSTFATVVDIEPNFLKIDGSIISKVTENKKSLIILDTIEFLANKMNIDTVGEFVENEEIQKILTEYGVTYSQGYLFSKPMPIQEIK